MDKSNDYELTLVPTGLIENLELRIQLLEKAKSNPKLQRGLYLLCKQDCLFFISVFVWQFNPLKAGKGLRAADPFIPWDLQKRALLKKPGVPWPGEADDELNDAGLVWVIENEKSLVIEKSREMGASWLCILVYLWYFLFHPYQKFHCISRNEEKVESEDSDSLFWKLDYVIEHLPPWLLPKNGIRRRKRFFGNDELRCQITGEACTADAGISGRCRSMLMDEFAKVKNQTEIRHGTASTTNCRIFNSTHEGMDTEFYAMCQSSEIYKLRMHWTQHPDKVKGLYLSTQPVKVLDKQYDYGSKFNFVLDGSPVGGPRPGIRSPWYDAKCQEIGSSRGVAQDLDINPSGAVSQFFEPLVINALIREYARPAEWEGELSYDRQTAKEAKFVRGGECRLRLWIAPPLTGPIVGRFAAGVDVAMGTGASPSCLSVGDADTGEKVAEFQSASMYPNDFAIFCCAVCSLFTTPSGDPPMLVWEKQGPGNIFKNQILKLGYRRFWYNDHGTVGNKMRGAEIEPGWNPGSSNNGKKILLETYKTALRKKEFLNLSRIGLEDTLAWKYDKSGGVVHAGFSNKDDFSGIRDNHGDQTIADALCWMVMEHLGVSAEKKAEVFYPQGSLQWRRQLHAAANHNARKVWVG